MLSLVIVCSAVTDAVPDHILNDVSGTGTLLLTCSILDG
jgi:hypothetical protein